MAKQNQPGSLGEARAMLEDQAKLKDLLSSAEVRQLAKLLDANSGHGLKSAARSARDGDTAQLEQMVKALAASPEGARLLSRIQGKLDS